jgi:hypothetical protein
MEIKRSRFLERKDIFGKGCFATKYYMPNELIGQYSGRPITDAKAETLRASTLFNVYMHDDFSNKTDLRGTPKNRIRWVIFPQEEDLLQYANSADKSSQQNCRYIQNGNKIEMYATRPIEPDEEFLTWYGDSNSNEEGVGTEAILEKALNFGQFHV